MLDDYHYLEEIRKTYPDAHHVNKKNGCIVFKCDKCKLVGEESHWNGKWLCEKCIDFKQWIGLVSSDGKTEWNARFCLGDKAAESLINGKTYSYDELDEMAEGYRVSEIFTGKQFLDGTIPELKMVFKKAILGCKESKQWKCVKL